MTDAATGISARTEPARPPSRPLAAVGAYAHLAKLDVFDYYLSLLVVWAALAPAIRLDPRSLATLVVFGVGEVSVMAGLVALDDLTGFRDGSDIANYGPDAPARRLIRKPLVAGTLTEAQVIRFGWITTLAGAGLWTAAFLIAPHRPVWVIVVAALTFVTSPQYSYGVKLSYHGFQEAYIAALGWALLLIPYGLVHGSVHGKADSFIIVQAFVFGLGPLLFGVYSNTNDIDGDRGVGRPTVAALTTPRGNAVFVAAVSTMELLAIVGAPVAGIAPWWFPLAMAPTIVLRAVQYDLGFRRHDILRARKLGFWVHRVTVALLILVNLIMAGV
ncbi:MAG TPA: UbiA family prenyltransferase [Pseudonocardiaceae bacterium]|jgi:1,4-dihydroxy-2-naphthoate octaprenyltransferase|nr:UbiA family prenyltransferase [Pseudonocardiaceae bacterium]